MICGGAGFKAVIKFLPCQHLRSLVAYLRNSDKVRLWCEAPGNERSYNTLIKDCVKKVKNALMIIQNMLGAKGCTVLCVSMVVKKVKRD